MEIGGYIEFPQFMGEMLHGNAIALNSARNCLAYLIEAKGIKKIALPKFLCASVGNVCKKYGLDVQYYSINHDFFPCDLRMEEDEWLYLVNYYGQIDNNQISEIKKNHDKVIIDNVQAYFQDPLSNVDTIYTCRKYFGVPDGAFLYTDSKINRELERDKSAKRMLHLLGRYENTANEYYSEYIANENLFENFPIRKMSKLTDDLLHSINYDQVKSVREQNYIYLSEKLKTFNKLQLKKTIGPFMYPFYIENGYQIRKFLQKDRIYVATLWPDVFDIAKETELEFDMARNILPLPCDQRYALEDMEYIVKKVCKYIG